MCWLLHSQRWGWIRTLVGGVGVGAGVGVMLLWAQTTADAAALCCWLFCVAQHPLLSCFDPEPYCTTRNLKTHTASGRGKRVAVVTVLSKDGEKRTYDATLVGADKARDLAVLKVRSGAESFLASMAAAWCLGLRPVVLELCVCAMGMLTFGVLGLINALLLRHPLNTPTPQVSAPADQLQPISLGESGSVRVGQQVLSIGNPFGAFDHTLTTGECEFGCQNRFWFGVS